MFLNTKVYYRAALIALRLILVGVSATLSNSVAQTAATPKILVDRAVLVSNEAYCISVTFHPDKPINLGTGQLTITFSRDGKGYEDVILVARITKPEIAIPKGISSLMLCGTVPQLTEKQTGVYFASDFSTHFGSGNVTSIGTPDSTLLDTEKLANQLKALDITFKR